MPTVFTKNRDRLLNQEVAREFLRHVVERRGLDVRRALHGRWDADRSVGESQELPAEGRAAGDGRNFRGQTRTNDTHASKTDPDARLYRKTFQGEGAPGVPGTC